VIGDTHARSPRFESSAEDIGGGTSRYAVIDLETTGLDVIGNRVIECAIVQLEVDGSVADEWSTLIAIPGTSDPGDIHGISRAMLDDAPTFSDVLGEIALQLQHRIIVGHVLDFDLAHLAAEFDRAGVTLPACRPAGICTRELARELLPEGSHALGACCAAAAVPIPDAHSALGDARATAALFAHFLRAGFTPLPSILDAAGSLDWPTNQFMSPGQPRAILRAR
jgi:DNA polymerase-3 subunit epsilon